ncbi:MAG: hypothetical protein AAGB22_05965 [Bacteroidota bacterium]
MNTRALHQIAFKALSVLPLVWLGALYLFTLACTIQLGHLPVPSLDDPKYFDLDLWYAAVWFGFIPLLSSPALWGIALWFSLKHATFSRTYCLLFVAGALLCTVQILFDPLRIIEWILD